METINIYSLPPGFGFHPTDAELISHYLKRKILGLKIEGEVIPEVDIYKCEPWDLPAKCHIPTRDFKWHFFASRDRKYPNGSRSNRATEAGYWKSTGKDRCIRSRNQVIGTKKTLVFHEGRPPLGKRTEWIMHEYYINDDLCKASPKMKDIFVLCRVTKRNGCTVDGTDFPPENEETNACPNTPKDVPVLLVQKESPCSTGTPEDFEAWINELCVPELCPIPTIHDLESDLKEDFSSVSLKQEPAYLQTEFLEGSHFFDCEGDDVYNCILPSLEPSDALNSGVLGEFSIGSAFSASTPKLNSKFLPDDFSSPKFTMDGDIGVYTSSSINESDIKLFDPTDRIQPNSDSCPIIQVRDRRDRPPTKWPTTYKSNLRVYNKLEVHKMESNNNKPVNLTMNFASQDHHLDQNDGFAQNPRTIGLEEKNFSAKFLSSSSFYLTESISEKSISEAEPKIISSAQGLIRTRFLLKSRFFLCACVIGAALIIIYYLMRDS